MVIGAYSSSKSLNPPNIKNVEVTKSSRAYVKPLPASGSETAPSFSERPFPQDPSVNDKDDIDCEKRGSKGKRSTQRQALKLYRRPIRTLYLFSCAAVDFASGCLVRALSAPVSKYLIFPLLVFYTALHFKEGPWTHMIGDFDVWLKFSVWWLGLGVASSVGFGTGFHSGVLFLFPHIFLVVRAATACGTTNFDTRQNVWSGANQPIVGCERHIGDGPVAPGVEEINGDVSFWALFAKVWFACFLWGTGTAWGEIPPFLFSRSAALAGRTDEGFQELQESQSQFEVVNRVKEVRD